jgi:hypothetical protein
MKPASSIKGIIVIVRTPPANIKSVVFIAISILTMLMKLILNAILIASAKVKVLIRIMVSNIMLVIKPFTIASNITAYIDKE